MPREGPSSWKVNILQLLRMDLYTECHTLKWKMPKTDTLDALDDEMNHTLNILWRNSEDTLKKLWRNSEETLRKLWRNSEETLRKNWRNSEETLKKLWRNSKETLKKLWRNSEETHSLSKNLTKFYKITLFNKFCNCRQKHSHFLRSSERASYPIAWKHSMADLFKKIMKKHWKHTI